MTLYQWSDVRAELTDAYTQSPGAQLEQDILSHFQDDPARVVHEGRNVATAYRNGNITSPWGALRKRLDDARNRGNVVALDTRPREQAKRHAEQWMRAAGVHYDRWTEVHDELFNERGRLHAFPDLEHEMRTLWDELRPDGERVERELYERAARYIQARPPGPPPADRPQPIILPTLPPKAATVSTPDDGIPF